MTDIGSLYDATVMAGDFGLQGDLLVADDGIATAVILSLFTDARANPDDTLPDDGASRRGWWGDLAAATVDGVPVQDDRIGSRLWLLVREKQMPDVLARAKEYAAEALQWLIDDGIAENVDVETSIVRPGVLGLAISIRRPAGAAITFKFDHAWQAQANGRTG